MNGIDELLLFLGSNPEEVREREGRKREEWGDRERSFYFLSSLQSQWCMHVLEITFLIMKEQVSSALNY